MNDPTERARQVLQQAINSNPLERPTLEEAFGKENVWDTKELQETFEVLGFAAPFCIVKRKSDGARGSVTFQHQPRFYYDFKPH